MKNSNPSRWSNSLARVRDALRARFSLAADRADDADIDARIRADVPLQGTNLWVLVFAIFIASIGLNVNSTAVIIGAMLISPLMGPIMAVGYGIGIRDAALVRQAGRNLALATLIALVTSTAYFAISPLRGPNSELLARTTPTIWDVLIAAFGGLAGIVAATRKRQSNIIPGVAIATALMPPLCTAGYGLATGSWQFFVGAFYLYAINSVFIASASAVVTSAFHVKKKQFADPRIERRVRWFLGATVVITLLPSTYLAFRLVGEELFRNRATQFVKRQFEVNGTHITDIEIDPKTRLIEVSLIGKPVSRSRLTEVINAMPGVGLSGAHLRTYQSGDQHIDVATLRSGVVRDSYEASNALLNEQGKALDKLQSEVDTLKGNGSRLRDIPAELTAIYPQLQDVVLAEGMEQGASTGAPDERVVVLTGQTKHRLRAADQERIERWLAARTGTARVRVRVVIDAR
jgi:uncharacterized hydrophobic protein (TIGR00271 family)